MPDKTHAGHEDHDKWEEKLAEAKVKNLSGQYGLTRESLEDLQQELLLHLWLKRQDKAYWATIRASEETVVSHILDNKIRDFLSAHQAKRRQILTNAESLSAYQDEEGRDRELPFPERPRQAFAEKIERQVAIERILQELSPRQAKAARLYMKGYTTSEVAPMLGMQRTALEREKKRMRKLFYRRRLGDAL